MNRWDTMQKYRISTQTTRAWSILPSFKMIYMNIFHLEDKICKKEKDLLSQTGYKPKKGDKLTWKRIACKQERLTVSISICTSDSASGEPNFRSPAFSSSTKTIPSLSASIFLNISLISSTSSADKNSAITWNKMLLKLSAIFTLIFFNLSHVTNK